MLGSTLASIDDAVDQIDNVAASALGAVKKAVASRKRIDPASTLKSLAEILLHVGELRKELAALRTELPIQ
jgi:hypothetical protein